MKAPMKVKVLPKSQDAMLPFYGTAGAACFDLSVPNRQPSVQIPPGQWATFDTGLIFEVPEGNVMLIGSRSGMGFKNQVRLSNCIGFIDSDYRGTVGVQLFNDGKSAVTINAGDRIAQAMIVEVPRVEFEVVDTLSETERGSGGFGSTGGFVVTTQTA